MKILIMTYPNATGRMESFLVPVEDEMADKITEIVSGFRRNESNYQRKMRYNKVGSLNKANYEYIASPDDIESQLAVESILQAVEKLPEQKRGRMKSHISGFSNREMALLEGVSDSAISQSLTDAQKILKDFLSEN